MEIIDGLMGAYIDNGRLERMMETIDYGYHNWKREGSGKHIYIERKSHRLWGL